MTKYQGCTQSDSPDLNSLIARLQNVPPNKRLSLEERSVLYHCYETICNVVDAHKVYDETMQSLYDSIALLNECASYTKLGLVRVHKVDVGNIDMLILIHALKYASIKHKVSSIKNNIWTEPWVLDVIGGICKHGNFASMSLAQLLKRMNTDKDKPKHTATAYRKKYALTTWYSDEDGRWCVDTRRAKHGKRRGARKVFKVHKWMKIY